MGPGPAARPAGAGGPAGSPSGRAPSVSAPNGGSATAGTVTAGTVTAGPSALAGMLQLLAAAGLVLAAVAGAIDRPGLLLALPVVVGLGVVGVRDLILRPVVSADVEGVTVVQGVRRVSAPWSEVERLRVVTERRAPLLEVDLGEVLMVLGRRRLGQRPEAVLADLLAVRPAR